MSDGENEAFLSRWSRRKIEARKEEEPAEPAPPPQPSPAAAPAASGAAAAQPGVSAPVELPPIESLKGLASEYRDFMQPGVDENLKRSALKQLFSDPHFENFERFEAYCEDYTQGEPIPLAMLKTLKHAKGLLFDEEEKEEKEEKGPVAEKAPAALPTPEAPPAQAAVKVDSASLPGQPEQET